MDERTVTLRSGAFVAIGLAFFWFGVVIGVLAPPEELIGGVREAVGWAAMVIMSFVFWPRYPYGVTPLVAGVTLALLGVSVWGLWEA